MATLNHTHVLLRAHQIIKAPPTIARAPVMASSTHCTLPPVWLPAFLPVGLGAALELVATFNGPRTPPCTFAGVTELATLFAAV